MTFPIKQTSNRLFPIDFLKALSIVAVVSFHSIFLFPSTFTSVSYPLEILFAPLKFCVPVLLTISFFLLKRSLEEKSKQPVYILLKKRLLRLLIPTAFWFSLAIIIRKIFFGQEINLFNSALKGTIFTGAYYLLILVQFIPLFILLHPWFERRRNIWLIFTLQSLVFLLIYASCSGIFGSELPLILRKFGRPLFIYWFIYMALGSYLYNNWSKIVKISSSISPKIKIGLLCITSLRMMAECGFLKTFTGERMAPYDYLLFSCIGSVIVCFLCFASVEESQVSMYARKAIKLLSTYCLGIFCINGCINVILFELIAPIFQETTFTFFEMLGMKLLGWFILLSLSLWLSLGINKIKLGVFVR